MRTLTAIVGIALAGTGGSPAHADELDDTPELDFLEYLGSWQAEDDEWIISAEWEPDTGTESHGKPEPERKQRE
jgi:hypothetical protein